MQHTHKDLTISYNFLTSPMQIQVLNGSMHFLYDATGRKWAKSGPEGLRWYVDNAEFLDGKIQHVAFADGRFVAEYDENGTFQGTYRAEYFRTDHPDLRYGTGLGNTRLTFSDFNHDMVISPRINSGTPTAYESEITSENHYYPFGLGHTGPWYASVAPENKYRYNGKEWNADWGLGLYDFGNRWQDPALGRFTTEDRFAEKYAFQSAYVMAANDPVKFVDVNGDSINVSHLREKNPEAWNQIKADIESFTGLSLSVSDNGFLLYEKPDGKIGGSKRAQKQLIRAIEHKETVTLKDDYTGVGSHVPYDSPDKRLQNTIYIDSKQIQSFIDGTSTDLDNSTFGFGMNFLHELGHTRVGGRMKDGGHATAGANVENDNKIRRQLGEKFGERVVYSQFRIPSDPGYEYFPFSKSAHEALLSKNLPRQGFVRVPIK